MSDDNVDSDSSLSNFLDERQPLINNNEFTNDYLLFRDQQRQQRSRISCCSFSSVATILFALVTVTGQVTQYVTLPLWIDSTSSSSSSLNQTVKWKPRLDSYFVVSFASLSFVIVFGFVILCSDLIRPNYLAKTDWRCRRLLLCSGCLYGVCSIFIVFSSSGSRTPPYLQAILGNFSIPITLLLRFVLLKKIPTRRKFLSASGVMLGLLICLIPVFYPQIDPQGQTHLGGATGAGRILWPFAFVIGFTFSAVSYIVAEKAIKMQGNGSQAQAGLVSVLFWVLLAQFLTVVPLFWVNIIPGFGNADNIHEFIQNWVFGLQCIFGGAGCSWTPGVLAVLFITGYIMAVCGSALLLRYSEGATLLAIVMSLCTPLGFMFWMFFREKPFGCHPYFHTSSWFSVTALIIMIPAAFIYNTGMPEREREEITPTNTER